MIYFDRVSALDYKARVQGHTRTSHILSSTHSPALLTSGTESHVSLALHSLLPIVRRLTPQYFRVSSKNVDPLPILQTPPRKAKSYGGSGSALSVCVSAKSSVHFSSFSTWRVASARSEGTPHPWMPPTAGRTTVAPRVNAEQTADPIPNA
mmetsp:Transcript_19012/g.38244  ORF Transcript_19012/g.38244 Transcript_19012/m.38244 type:complete len:151 (+) Transcript_19012:893-1345(+)